ncbi:MAG: class I SAM-dependent methyltransferase [Actinomycetota bacterium]
MSEPGGRVEREQAFHDALAGEGFEDRRLIGRMGGLFYDTDRLWGPVWSEVGDLTGLHVLEYACGDGSFAVHVAERGANVHGIDISPNLVALARDRAAASAAHERLRFSVMDAHATEFRAGSFDLVLGNGSLHHLDLDRALDEVARVLRPGGRAYFVEPLRDHPALRLFRRLTPRARSEDERPLGLEDLERAHRRFGRVRHIERYVFAVAAAPIALLSPALAAGAFRALSAADRGLLRRFPQVRRYAWITLLELERGEQVAPGLLTGP